MTSSVTNLILTTAVFMFALSTILGVLILIFSKVFEVKVDPRIQEINTVLPAYNCGSCGYPGCIQYATAIVTENAPPTKCTPGGAEVSAKIRAILEKAESANS
jgi:RnfABCDGE-type electron transport complex B subunit